MKITKLGTQFKLINQNKGALGARKHDFRKTHVFVMCRWLTRSHRPQRCLQSLRMVSPVTRIWHIQLNPANACSARL